MPLALPQFLLAVLTFLVSGFLINMLIWQVIFGKKVRKFYEENKDLMPPHFSMAKGAISGNILLFLAGIFFALLLKLTKNELGMIEGSEYIHGFIVGLLVWMTAIVPPNLTWMIYNRTSRDLMSLNLLAWFFIFTVGGILMNAILS